VIRRVAPVAERTALERWNGEPGYWRGFPDDWCLDCQGPLYLIDYHGDMPDYCLACEKARATNGS
jgi:hypothetical protein